MSTDILRSSWLWVLLCLGLVFTAIFSRPLLPIDETRYLSVAWEMWQNNQFLVPHINGQPYSHKPPLFFWLIHFGWWLFGVNEWTARLTAPIFGLASLFLTKRLAAVLWPAFLDISRTSPMILLGMGVWSIFFTLTMFDTLVVFFSLAAYLVVLTGLKHSYWSWPLLGLIIGLALLAKGPVALIYIAPPIILGPLWINRPSTNWLRWYCGFLFALTVGVLLVLTWAIPASLAGGQDYGNAILFGQTAGRIAHSFAHQRPFYWYFLLIPLILFPWSLWLPFWRGWKIPCDKPLRFCLCVLIPALIALSLISGKQIHYVLPLLPIIAIILSRISVSAPVQKPHDKWIFFIFFVLLAGLLLVTPVLPVLGRDAAILKYIPISASLIPLLTGLILLWTWPHLKTGQGPAIISFCVLLHLMFLHMALSQAINLLFNPGGIIRSLSLAQNDDGAIAVYPGGLADQFQFSARLTKPIVAVNDFPALQRWVLENPADYCLILADKKNLPLLENTTEAVPYKDKLLLFSKAQQLIPVVKKFSPDI